jgi:hypothetical protein
MTVEEIEQLRQREVQALHAGISRRDWWATEKAANELRDKIDAAMTRAALSTRPAPVEGWRLVPVEPTEKMMAAGEHAWKHRNLNDPNSHPIRDCYKAMLSAVPVSPEVK